MPPPTTASGKLVLDGLTSLSRELKFYADGFKATQKLRGTIAEIDQIKRGVSSATQSTKQLEKQFKNTKKIADDGKKLWDNFLSKIKGGNPASKAASAGGSIGGLLLIGGVAALVALQAKVTEFTQFQQELQNNRFSEDLSKQLGILTQVNNANRRQDKEIEAINKKLITVTDKVYAEASSASKNATRAREQSNEALYETRQGRTILESKISDVRKLANDALYETRQGRAKLDATLNDLKIKTEQSIKGIQLNLTAAINTTIKDVQVGLKATNEKVNILNGLLTKAQSGVTTATTTANNALAAVKNIPSSIANLPATISKQLQDLQASTTSELKKVEKTSKEYADKLVSEAELVTQKQLKKDVLTPLEEVTKTTKEIEKDITSLEKDLSLLQQQGGAKEVQTLKAQIANQQNSNKATLDDLKKLEARIKEQEKVNEEGNRKLDQIIPMLGAIPLIPGRVADAIKPNLLTKPDIEAATQTGMCKSLNGGCSGKALDNAVSNINNNTNNGLGNVANTILNGINTGQNAAQLAMLNTIDAKLGDQLPGGLSGTFGRLWQTLQVDRVLNVIILITTFHNGLMLSNDIGQTLFGAIDNISQSIGFKWQNEKGEETGFGGIVSEWTTNFFKTIFGTENYTALVSVYKKANRIYQAGANILNATRSIVDSTRNIMEYAAENTGRIGNALKAFGAINFDAFRWMPENVDGRSIWIRRLENAQEIASGIEMVSGEVLSVTQNINEIREQTEEFNRGIKGLPPKDREENEPVANREATAGLASFSIEIPQELERSPNS